jgi:hypothetical protein
MHLMARLVQASLRCYPPRWRRRHGDEAAELAALLIRDGRPAASIACSYLAGAAREWLTPRPGRRASAIAGALLAVTCLLGVSAGLLASAGPARAASTSQPSLPAHCRPGSSIPGLFSAPGLLPAPGRAHVTLRGAGHGKSC